MMPEWTLKTWITPMPATGVLGAMEAWAASTQRCSSRCSWVEEVVAWVGWEEVVVVQGACGSTSDELRKNKYRSWGLCSHPVDDLERSCECFAIWVRQMDINRQYKTFGMK
mmetsp:Transcript_4947/g.6790  ORF Transcript_4947/g.6790 Transcript_4947/m.6790 type:complete len:111 (-) Transcript_4947:35-367(-)